MKTVEEIKAEQAAIIWRFGAIWGGIVLLFFILDIGLGIRWGPSVLAVLVLPAILFLTVRRAKASGDEYEIFSVYRLFAIAMTCGCFGVLVSEIAEREGYSSGLSVANIMILSCAAGALGLAIYDRYFDRGDAE